LILVGTSLLLNAQVKWMNLFKLAVSKKVFQEESG